MRGLESLEGLKELRELDLTCKHVEDISFYHMGNLKQLEVLKLSETPNWELTPPLEDSRTNMANGCKYFAKLKKLRKLDLKMTFIPIKDDELQSLADISDLEELRLDGECITNAGLVHLQKLSRLRILELDFMTSGNRFPDLEKGIETLQKALPLLQVDYSYHTTSWKQFTRPPKSQPTGRDAP